MRRLLCAAAYSASLLAAAASAAAPPVSPPAAQVRARTIFHEGGPNVRGDWQLADDGFASRELARYIYLTTGRMPTIVDVSKAGPVAAVRTAMVDPHHEVILVASPVRTQQPPDNG
eukprot:SAG31_NODE_56_length_29726_cov_41.443312_23_plen_116_part_00